MKLYKLITNLLSLFSVRRLLKVRTAAFVSIFSQVSFLSLNDKVISELVNCYPNQGRASALIFSHGFFFSLFKLVYTFLHR